MKPKDPLFFVLQGVNLLKFLLLRSSSKSGPASSKKSGPASSKKSGKSGEKKSKSKEAVSSDSDSDDFVSSAKTNGAKKGDDKTVEKSDNDDDDEKTFKVAPVHFR